MLKGHADKDTPSWRYDDAFLSSQAYIVNYERSPYYELRRQVLDFCNEPRLIDIGCGPGQFACMVHDWGCVEYTGVDFSGVAIKRCKNLCKNFDGFSFIKGDICKAELWETLNGLEGIFTFVEVLEHITNDKGVLDNLRKNAHIVATLPKFDAKYHIRYFEDVGDVKSRFDEQLDITRVRDMDNFVIIGGSVK